MMDDDRKAAGYTPVTHWITREESYAQQEARTVRSGRPSYSDPTADAAIARIMGEAKREKRRQQNQQKRRKKRHNKKKSNQPRVGVWRWDDEQKKDKETKDKRKKCEGRKQDGREKESGTGTKAKAKPGRGKN